MEFKITHFTTAAFPGDDEVKYISKEGNVDIEAVKKAAKLLGGREAGICYMKDSYFEKGINNAETAMKRANNIIDKHHSPFDHFTIGIEISGIPKICAMILNSVGFYNTSEKSARYTVMHPETEAELNIYNKWVEKFKEIIVKTYPDMKDAPNLEKLAMENARYTISVFTPTSMGYTTTYRMYSYMYGWLNDLIDTITNRDNITTFDSKLVAPLKEIRDFFGELTNNGEVKDYKNRRFNFLRKQYYPEDNLFKSRGDLSVATNRVVLYNVYDISYKCSFACLAQLQRHRTIDYQMSYNGLKNEYYIPKIIKEHDKLTAEWLEDLGSIRECFPQATLIDVIERGTVDDFILKAKERLCGRAQLEIQNLTLNWMENLLESIPVIDDPILKEELKSCSIVIGAFTNSGTVMALRGGSKCELGICAEPCRWYRNWAGRMI